MTGGRFGDGSRFFIGEDAEDDDDDEDFTLLLEHHRLMLGPAPRSAVSNPASPMPRTSCKKCFLVGVLLTTLLVICYLPLLQRGSTKPMTFVWPENQTRSASELILPGERTTVISPAGVCNKGEAGGEAKISEQPILLVLVESALRNRRERRVVRESWARPSMVPAPQARVVFLVGQSLNGSFQDDIQEESSLYGDILQEGFVDSYANLSVKSLMLAKWFTQNCDNVPYVLKTDDDVFVNVRNLLKFVVDNRKPNLLTGTLQCGAVPIRDPHNKWFAPKYMIEAAVYPNYLSGTAYLMSRSMAQILFEASSEVPVFHLEDIYMTGLLAEAVGVRPEDHRGFSYLKTRLDACLYSQIFSSHHLSASEMVDMADQVEKVGDCATLKKEHLRRYAPNKCKWKGKQRRPTFGTKNNIIKTKIKSRKSMRDVISALTKPQS